MMLATRALLAAAVCVWTFPLPARTLDVGRDHRFKLPSEAVAAARDGDTIEIYPGQYFDCAIVRQSNIIIQGKGAGVVMTDTTCGGKAILVTAGDNITIRNLTLQRARGPYRNGAGVRAEGGDLTVENSRFVDNSDVGFISGGGDCLIEFLFKCVDVGHSTHSGMKAKSVSCGLPPAWVSMQCTWPR